MDFQRSETFTFTLTRGEKDVLDELSAREGEYKSVVVRGLIRRAARDQGLWPPHKARERRGRRHQKVALSRAANQPTRATAQ